MDHRIITMYVQVYKMASISFFLVHLAPSIHVMETC